MSGELKLTRNFDFYNGSEYQNIYITSDEEIKKGDWVIQINFENTNTQSIQCITEFQVKIANDKNGSFTKNKVILTTDQDLIADGVQPIDDEFLESFVKNPSCEFVEIVKCRGYLHLSYMIIIPQEEPKLTIEEYEQQGMEKYAHKFKHETLEEAAAKYVKTKWEPAQEENRESFIDGAKWQAERMYSEEEVQLIASKLLTDIKNGNAGNSVEWFEQFKKKGGDK